MRSKNEQLAKGISLGNKQTCRKDRHVNAQFPCPMISKMPKKEQKEKMVRSFVPSMPCCVCCKTDMQTDPEKRDQKDLHQSGSSHAIRRSHVQPFRPDLHLAQLSAGELRFVR